LFRKLLKKQGRAPSDRIGRCSVPAVPDRLLSSTAIRPRISRPTTKCCWIQ
jgi:hypothetical protein